MQFTVAFITLLSISTSWGSKEATEESKDKREAPVGYPSSSHSFPGSSLGHEDASAISIGAGYSVGGAKPSFSFGGHGSSGGLQLSSEGLPSSGHASIQLPPITLQSTHGNLGASDISQLMSQLSHGLNTGAISLQSLQSGSLGGYSGGQELSLPQFSYGTPKLQQYSVTEQSQGGVPSYAAGTKGLGSYSSTGPVLFNPSDSQSSQAALAYSSPSSGHSFGGDASGISLGGSGNSLGGLSLGGSGLSLGGSFKSLGGSYIVPSKTSFKPSAFLGATVQGDSGHGLSGLSGSYGAPSFGGSSLSGSHGGLSLSSGGHGASFGGSLGGFGGGSSKYISSSYLPSKSEGFGSSLESVASFASGGHLASPPGTTYGIPTASYGLPSNSAHAASSISPQYYISSSKHSSPSFGEGSTSYKAPISGSSSLSSFSSSPKYSFGGHSSPSSRYGAPKDSHGAYSESTYNTIKYSAELKPHVH